MRNQRKAGARIGLPFPAVRAPRHVAESTAEGLWAFRVGFVTLDGVLSLASKKEGLRPSGSRSKSRRAQPGPVATVPTSSPDLTHERGTWHPL
jgi:hypothetical protein